MQHLNSNSESYVAWGFKAGGAPSGNGKKIVDGTESNLTSGTDYSASDFSAIRQSVNTTGDFSITTYTGNGSTDGWFKHGLSGTPDWVIIKSTSATYNWIVWHSGLNSGSSTAASDYIQLNGNDEKGDYAGSANTSIDPWAGSGYGITSDKINLNYGGVVLENGQSYVCYAWKAVSGVSAFGTYEGNSSGYQSNGDGGVSNLSFKPRFVMVKGIDNSSRQWVIHDAFRVASDTKTSNLYANLTNSDDVDGGHEIVFYNNGFRFNTNSTYVSINANNETYIYAAFA